MAQIKMAANSIALACAVGLSMTILGVGPFGVNSASAQTSGYSGQQAYFTQAQIDQLVAPIALYPDPLLAQVLAAAAYPSEINAAMIYMARFGKSAAIDRQPWDYSVKAVAHYPTALQWLASDPPRTQALGIAYINQPDAVASAIQRWRAQAYVLGNLHSNPKQTVYVDADNVRIVPAEPRSLYVPSYDPRLIYVEPYRPNYEFLGYGVANALGAWLDKDWDWRTRRIYYSDTRRGDRGLPQFSASFDQASVDPAREWQVEQARFRPPARIVYPTNIDDRGAPTPPSDRRPRDRKVAAPLGYASNPMAVSGVVPPPGKLAPPETAMIGNEGQGRPLQAGTPGGQGPTLIPVSSSSQDWAAK